ncbi:hypothetical protein ARMGADRAFT_1087412 [Armillaria gallica]|uniref:Uncharacterized protein n=1 Tax=Armillaria gallica TaxID=47427 RepID=A0A2H3D8Z4_ARMGA|nr:hypothetical protein ARMGADRAFT_1087412 [Armillaria gallica]
MSSTLLCTLHDDVLGLIIKFCPDSTKDLATAWTEQMEDHCWYLINSFDLPKDMRPKQYWGPAELRLLIEESFQLLASLKNGMTMDQILQHILLWSVMMMTSCHPRSFLKTSHYPDKWLKFSDLALHRTPQQGVFNVLVTICHWKGGHTNQPYVAMFTIRGITHENMWSMDIGLQLIAIGLQRRGFLKYKMLNELLDREDLILQWKPKFGNELPTLVDIWNKDGESHFIDDLGLHEIVERLKVTETDIVDKCVLDAPEDHDKHMGLCGDVYKHVHARYVQLLCLVWDDHQKGIISETYAEDLKNMSLNMYEEHRQETQKLIGLPPILHSMLEEESK